MDQAGQIIQGVVDGADVPASFRSLLYLPLRQPGQTLSAEPRPFWAHLVLACCRAAGGDECAVPPIAAATELFVAAADALDEIEDGDRSPLIEAAGPILALNVPTALVMLAQQILARLGEWQIPAERVPTFMGTLSAMGLTATGGQHLDLAAEGRADLSPDDALDIARRKSGALIGGACRLGALLGTTDTTLLVLYEGWGRHYGTASQLRNDLADAGDATGKSDWERAKGTLPLVYARDAAIATGRRPVATLEATGALHFAWVVAEVERQRCTAVLGQLAERGQDIVGLRALMDRR